MLKIKSIYPAKIISLAVALVILLSYPLAAVALADAGPTGPSAPPGPGASTYTYNPGTGLWENAYYTWDPTTQMFSPKTPLNYSYNPATGKWDTTEWVYDAPSGKYVPNVKTVVSDPDVISNTGPNSNNQVDQTVNNNGTFDNFFNAAISNTSTSHATSGDATVSNNTSGGGATSGDASGLVNILNILQSNWNPQNLPTVFNADINGDVTGDLVLDPNIIQHTGPGSTSGINATRNNNLTINSDANGTINNDITLDAASGSAGVTGNTSGGDATSGDANVVANLINVLNSAITDGHAFIGNININGNLDGDILLPPGFLEQLISNSGPSSNVSTSQTTNNSVVANFNDNQTINNLTNLNATSGKADVSGNTTAGTAKTGKADTNLTVLNLTGQQVIGKNTILVFINVRGHWVGALMNAPGGSNSAAYCGGNCTINSLSSNNATINETSHNTINNNLNLNALSGNASVSGNTKAGNATSGNASASANILNISGSDLAAMDWLGILFINVNGFWNGSFGFNTSAGNANNPVAASPAAAAIAKVFKVESTPDGGFKITPAGGSTAGSATGSSQTASAAAKAFHAALSAKTHKKSGIPMWVPITIAVVMTSLVLLGGFISELSDRIWAMRIARSQGQKRLASTSRSLPSLNLPKMQINQLVLGQVTQLRSWLTSFSWKLPLL